LLHTLSAGDHVVASQDLYGGCYRQFTKVWARFGVRFTFVDASSEAAIAAALTPATKLLWLETPSNPLLRITPLRAACALARAVGARTVVDNTFATPLLQRPLEHGADIVLHSTTKYIGGHCDVLGGALVTSDPAIAEEIRFLQNAIGAVPSPSDCQLLLRGIRTLGLRVERHAATASVLAHELVDAPGVACVLYPGLRSHPGFAVAARQMNGFGGIVSLHLTGGRPAVERFARATRLWTLAESLGGFKSLWCHPATMTHASVEPAERARVGITEGTIRLSVGLEDPRDLLADLRGALRAVDCEVAA
ncbi:MAG: PLP-dependent transferase, partial [Phycisphaerae bacterium]|nr:PLP-dependent transferase [Phycisphaerae bacterium]